MLDALLTPGDDGRLNWNEIRSHQAGGCIAAKVGFDEVYKSIKPNHKYARQATSTALSLSRKGFQVSLRITQHTGR